jgi:cell division protein FtsW
MSLTRFRSRPVGKIDAWLLLAVLGLAGFGLVMISSSSVVLASQQFDNNYVFVIRQAEHLSIGLLLMVILAAIDYRLWQRLAPFFLAAIFILLLATLIPGIGAQLKGSRRWISIGPIFFQTTEMIKILSILFFAAWLAAREDKIRSFAKGFAPFVMMLGGILLLILAQPDAGTALVTGATLISMYIVAGAPIIHLFFGAMLGGSVFGLLILSAPYRLQRFMVFLNPDQATLGAAYHINQALLAIGAGGLWGLGFGQSKQKFLYLPEPHTDSIFAITIEELGFLRALLVIGVLLFVVYRGYQIARTATDPFARYTAIGITSLIAFQSFVNIGAMLGLLPLTGVTLPFISYGGSSLIGLLAAIGILLNVSRVGMGKLRSK